MQKYYTPPHSEYSPSEKGALDVLKDAQIDLSPKEIADRCDFSHSTITKALKKLEDKEKVVITRDMGQTKLYESASKRQLKYNLRYSNSNGEGYIDDFILDTLEYAKQDVSIVHLAAVSGFSESHLRNAMKKLVEEGLVTKTRKIDQAHLYTVE